jgi:isoquinoline 1-oxidoreductase subunit alpha
MASRLWRTVLVGRVLSLRVDDVPQCGYCQSGMIMAVADLLKNNPKPTDAAIDAAITNICRCGTFQQVRAAIHAAASA